MRRKTNLKKRGKRSTALCLVAAVLLGMPGAVWADEASPTDADLPDILPCESPAVTLATDTDAIIFAEDLDAATVWGDSASVYLPESQDEAIYAAGNLPAVYPSGVSNTNISPITNSFPEVKDQGSDGICWAYATVASAEIYGVKNNQASKSIDFSETALAYSLNYSVDDPLGNLDGGNILKNTPSGYYMQAGGNGGLAMELFYQGLGPVYEMDVPASNKLSYAAYGIPATTLRNPAAHITSFQRVNIADDREYLKKLIMEENTTAVAGYYSYYSFYDDDHASYCSTGYYVTNHTMVIVGWNDNFPASYFKETPKDASGNAANGAWLVRNSWGDQGLSRDGYFWISYYDPSLLYTQVADGYSNNTAYVATYDYDKDWDYNYQYDGCVVSTRLRTSTETVSAAAFYTVNGKQVNSNDARENLTAVSCEVGTVNTAYKVEIYRNPTGTDPTTGELQADATVSGRFSGVGAYTVELASPVQLDYGERFAVVVTLSDAPDGAPGFMIECSSATSFSNGGIREYTAELKSGQNSFRMGNGAWYDLTALAEMNPSYGDCGNFRIKALTEGAGNPNPDQKVTRVSMSAVQRSTLLSGENVSLDAVAYPANANDRRILWKSSNPSVLSVSSGGRIVAKDVKNATPVTITAEAADGSGKSASTTFTVIPAAGVAGRAHVQTYGWQNNQGNLYGTTGKAKRLEAIELAVYGNDKLGLTYTTHCQTYGWLNWVKDGAMSGTSGEAKRLEALEIKLTGDDASYYDVYYRVHVQHFGWMGWAKNGNPSGSAGYAYRMEALQILVLPKWMRPGNDLDGITSRMSAAYQDKNGLPSVSYQTHVQTYGWQDWKTGGTMSGTEGEAKRLEGIRIKLSGNDRPGGITYRTHVQTYGWQAWKSNGAMAGTSGERKRLESIEIKLTGDMVEAYDVYYRVHAQHFGWMGWAKNGESAGTAGFAYRLEGIQIVLVPKGSAAPDKNYGGKKQMTAAAFRSK